MRSIIALCVLLACAAASAGEVYKWKDKDGRVHYGDKPKHGEAASVIVEAGSGSGVPSPGESTRQAREAECTRKKAQFETYSRAPSISEIDNLGKQREYTPAEREQFLTLTAQKVAELCAPPPPAEVSTFPQPINEPVVPPPPEQPPAEQPPRP